MNERSTAGDGAFTEFADGVLTVTFDRQEKVNAISPAMTAILWDAVRRLRDDDEVALLMITAVGRFFTAGIDLNSPTGRGGDVDPNEEHAGLHFRKRYRDHHLLYDEIEAVEKPVIVAAQANCFGAGIEMAVSCDFRVCARSTRFRLPEVNLGVIAGSGGISRLTRLVGPGWARWLAMGSRTIDAERALAIGLVHEVYDDDVFAEQARQLAREIAANSREAMALSKLAIDAAVDSDRTTARNVERMANNMLTFGKEFRSKVVDKDGQSARDR